MVWRRVVTVPTLASVCKSDRIVVNSASADVNCISQSARDSSARLCASLASDWNAIVVKNGDIKGVRVGGWLWLLVPDNVCGAPAWCVPRRTFTGWCQFAGELNLTILGGYTAGKFDLNIAAGVAIVRDFIVAQSTNSLAMSTKRS